MKNAKTKNKLYQAGDSVYKLIVIFLSQDPFRKKISKFLYYHDPQTIFLLVKDLISVEEPVSFEEPPSARLACFGMKIDIIKNYLL